MTSASFGVAARLAAVRPFARIVPAIFIGFAAIGAAVAPATPGLDVHPRPKALRIDGRAAYASSGYALAGAGDVDGDGRDDILIGAYGASPYGRALAGETTLVFGAAVADALAAGDVLDLGDLPEGQAIRILGRNPNDRNGIAVASAGDVDGDGRADILVGAHFAEPDGRPRAGETTLLFGRALARAAAQGRTAFDLRTLRAEDGVRILGLPETRSGWALAAAGDVDGDGLSDILVGTHVARGMPGAAHLVFGSTLAEADRNAGIVDLAALGPGRGVTIGDGEPDDFAGLQVAGAGDVDRDGRSDLIIGAFGAERDGAARAGAAYLVQGAALADATSPFSLGSLTPGDGAVIAGRAALANFGRSVAGVGDIDGDGAADVLVGAWAAAPRGRHWSGEITLIFGDALEAAMGPTGHGEVDLGPTNRAGTVRIEGAGPDDFAGWAIASAGDVDGDRRPDIIIGAYGAGVAGAAYVVFGAAIAAAAQDAGRAIIDLGSLERHEGVVIDGAVAGSNTGFSVAHAGDVDGDGLSDVLVGAPYADLGVGRERAGQSFIVTGATLLAARHGHGRLDLGDGEGLIAAGRIRRGEGS